MFGWFNCPFCKWSNQLHVVTLCFLKFSKRGNRYCQSNIGNWAIPSGSFVWTDTVGLTVKLARSRAYEVIAQIDLPGRQLRTDIGLRDPVA